MEAIFIRDENTVGVEMQSLISSLQDDRTMTAIGKEVEGLRSASKDDIDSAYRALVSEMKNHDPVEDRGSNIRLLVELIGFAFGCRESANASSASSKHRPLLASHKNDCAMLYSRGAADFKHHSVGADRCVPGRCRSSSRPGSAWFQVSSLGARCR